MKNNGNMPLKKNGSGRDSGFGNGSSKRKKMKVLVIDDDANMLTTISAILQSEGYEAVVLDDPLKAEEYIEKYLPNLMLIDIFMPGRSGFNLLEDFEQRGLYRDIPKIFITGLDDDIERMIAKVCGVKRYITKPFLPEDVLNSVEEVLKN